jgi:type II secretory pathway component PulK
VFGESAGNGFDEQHARGLAAKIIDWRDGDDRRGEAGAERDHYRAAGRTSGPRNGPFETVSELKQVLGMEQITDELLAALTVYFGWTRSSAAAERTRALREKYYACKRARKHERNYVEPRWCVWQATVMIRQWSFTGADPAFGTSSSLEHLILRNV